MVCINKLLFTLIIYCLKFKNSLSTKVDLNTVKEVNTIHVPLDLHIKSKSKDPNPRKSISKSNDDEKVLLYPSELINIPAESHVYVIEDNTDSVDHKVEHFIHKVKNLDNESKEGRQTNKTRAVFEIKFPEKGDAGIFAPLVINPVFSNDVNLTANDLQYLYMSYKGNFSYSLIYTNFNR